MPWWSQPPEVGVKKAPQTAAVPIPNAAPEVQEKKKETPPLVKVQPLLPPIINAPPKKIEPIVPVPELMPDEGMVLQAVRELNFSSFGSMAI